MYSYNNLYNRELGKTTFRLPIVKGIFSNLII